MASLSLLWGWVLMAALSTGANASLVEQRPRWALVRPGQAETLSCFLRDAQYPWMSWYQQDLQGQLQVLASLRFSGDKDDVSLPGANYQVTRVDDKELRLQVANVTQGRTLYCTCSKDTVNAGCVAQRWTTGLDHLQTVALPPVSCGEDCISLKGSFCVCKVQRATLLSSEGPCEDEA